MLFWHRRRGFVGIFFLLLALAVSGCSTTYVWYSPDKTEALQRQDKYACEGDAARYSQEMGRPGKEAMVKKRMQECMELRGYKWLPEDQVQKPVLAAPPRIAAPAMAATPANRLRITNSCAYPIWLQQEKYADVEIIKLEPGKSYDYTTPAAGLASTRIWPKAGCKDDGQDCKIGQTVAPCPDSGCHPPYGSKMEATWGCTLENKSQCKKTPQGDTMLETYFNMSAVDGYSFPFTVQVTGANDRFKKSCSGIDCSGLDIAKCPIDDDLSKGRGTDKFPANNKVDLRVYKTTQPSEILGCYSTSQVFTWAKGTAFSGGKGLDPQDPQVVMYACPDPPIKSAECSKGPVVDTKYVKAIHEMCKKTAYSYAYDDGVGLRHCNAEAAFEVVFGPNCPAQFNRRGN